MRILLLLVCLVVPVSFSFGLEYDWSREQPGPAGYKCKDMPSIHRLGGMTREEALHAAKQACIASFGQQIQRCYDRGGMPSYPEPFACKFVSTDQNGPDPWQATYEKYTPVSCCIR